MLHLVPGETGGSELYARRLVPALLDARPELEIVAFAPREGAPSLAAEPWGRNVEVIEVAVKARSRVARVLAEQTLLPAAARRAGIDLLHNVFNTAPALPGVVQVSTIHDLIYKRFPEDQGAVFSRGLGLLVPLAARRSRRVIVPSRATCDDVVRYLGVESARVDVTPEGPGLLPGIRPVPEREVRRRLDLQDRQVVLSVSAKRWHKNIARLIDAIATLPQPAPVLLVPGYPTVHEGELQARVDAMGIADRVRFLGWVDEGMLEGLYATATCFAFPSLAEGFGLPVLEAMLRGVAVACSNLTSLPELAGQAARYFEPTDTDAIAAVISELLGNAGLRERLAAAGRVRAATFTWERCAQLTLESYDRALRAG